MRRLFPLAYLAFLCSCGGGGGSDLPQTIDGTWNTTSPVAGSTIALTLKEQNTQVVGAGTYRIEAGASGALVVAGVHSSPLVTLELAYDNGNKATYAAALTDSTHMSGALTFQGAGTSKVEFARQ
jgi:hypothetical protein